KRNKILKPSHYNTRSGNTMNIIMLSGGSGKRLWPLSNDTMSKQFIKLLKDKDGSYQSMVQRVYGQLGEAKMQGNVVVATNMAQADAIRGQLGEQVELVIEPERRNTYPAILLSCAYLYFKKKVSECEAVAVLPIDVYAGQEYFEGLSRMEEALNTSHADLLLMGAEPTYPSEKYGYIVPAYGKDGIYKASRFVEKPIKQQAQQLIRDGALWNCGVFAFKLGFAVEMLKHSGLPMNDYETFISHYAELEATSFDYAVAEKAKDIAVVKHMGYWKDLGTWNTLTEEMTEHKIGEDILLSDDCLNTHIINMLDIPLIGMGLKDIVVVASHDGILVTDKGQSSYLKPYADKVTKRPMYEIKPWGKYRVIDHAKSTEAQTSLTKRINMQAGMTVDNHYHTNYTQICVITAGEGVFEIDGKEQRVFPTSVISIPMETRHTIKALTDLEWIEVQIGSELSEDDTNT
ncbi:MAG: sugar phosphate nucleotidyltransferase, partial [Angelakisella sp.]